MNEEEQECGKKAEELVKLIKEGGYSVEELKQALMALVQEEKMADEEAEPTKEDGEKIFGMKFKE